MSNPLPPNLPAWLDHVEAYCKKATKWPLRINRFDEENGEIVYQIQADSHPFDVLCSFGDSDNPRAKHDAEFNVNASTDLPLAVQVIRRLMEAMQELTNEIGAGAHTLYQQKAILKTDRNWLLGKVQKARAALQETRDERTP